VVAVASAARTAPDRADTSGWTAQHVLATVSGGLGVAALGAAAYFGIRSKSLHDDAGDYCTSLGLICTQTCLEHLKASSDTQTTAFVLLAVGGGLLGSGALLFATAPSRAPARLSARVGPGSVSFEGAF